MKKIAIIPFFIYLSVQAFSQNLTKDNIAEQYANTITAADLSKYLHILASDSMEGRETGMKGQKMAANYIKKHFIDNGLNPVVKTNNGEDYFQKFELVKKEWKEVYLKVKKRKLEFLNDFYAYGDFKIPEEEKLDVVFAGYGIDSPNYSDYKNIDVKDKTVIFFMGEPMKDSISLVSRKKEMSDWANDWRKKSAAAKAKGAKYAFVIVGTKQADFETRLGQLKYHLAQPTLGFTYKQRPGSAFFIPVALAAEMLKTKEAKLLKYKESLNEGAQKNKFKSAKVSAKVDVNEIKINTENVLGYVEGSDKKDEVVILTAHYDHIGKEGNKIYYGADDDGSGTSAILELSQAFAKAKKEGHGPRRSILFMPVTGEEKGLLGSEYYTDNPVFPLSKTVADLNIDMIGRLDDAHLNNPNYVYIIGSNRLSTDLHRISESVNKTYTNIELDYKFNSYDDSNRFYYRSDHYNFAKNKIPVIFYFSGVHKDYHQPTDTVDKILFDKMEKITKLVFFTAWELANQEKRIEVNVTE